MKIQAKLGTRVFKAYNLKITSFQNLELVSNESFDCYPDKTLGSFTNSFPKQVNFEEEWEVSIADFS